MSRSVRMNNRNTLCRIINKYRNKLNYPFRNGKKIKTKQENKSPFLVKERDL